MADKLHNLNNVDDNLRRFLCSEPRSGPAGSFCLLTPACDQTADVGLIILQPDQAHAMSGSNANLAASSLPSCWARPESDLTPLCEIGFRGSAGFMR